MINSLRKWILVSGFSINLTHFRSSKIQYLFWVNKWTTKSYLLRHREASGEFFKLIKNIKWGGNSLAVEWLGFCNFTAEGTGSVPAQGTKILQTAQDDIYIYEKWKLLVAQSCLTLCNLMDCSPPISSAHGILQARILEWVAFPSPGDLSNPVIKPGSLASPTLAGGFFTTSATWDTLHGLNCILPNSYADSLTSNMIGFGNGTLGR